MPATEYLKAFLSSPYEAGWQYMEALSAYVAVDRQRKLAEGEPLAERTTGAALFADISGFTSLTETLARSLGPRRGAEELSIHLNSVYEALIEEVERFGGSVVAFAGDAITAWFDQDDGRRATTAALEMQARMLRFSAIRLPDGQSRSLAVKVGIAHGSVRRFLVGDPKLGLLDVIAGRTLSAMAGAAALASQGEVVVTSGVASALGDSAALDEWRHNPEHDGRFAAVAALRQPAPEARLQPLGAIDEEVLRPFLIKPVWDRLRAGQGEFLTELRPAVTLFLSFEGIDYDNEDDAGARLDAYVRWVQAVAHRFGGFLLAVGMGDKGSHLYCSFGAPIAHEHSIWCAVSAAWELRTPLPFLVGISATRIGLSSGTLRTGAYGSTTRRTYGVLGDAANLAARLMERAEPGQVLASPEIRSATADAFGWEALQALELKGKAGSLPVHALVEATERTGTRLFERQYALPMVGRKREMACLDEKLALAARGQGQVVWVTAEAGMGKSRLVAEFFKHGREQGFGAYVGQCQAHATHARYTAWHNVWQGVFELSAGSEGQQAVVELTERLTAIDPGLLPRLPLLSAVLNVALPENDVTRPLEARLRKTSLHALLVTCLRHLARRRPLLLVIEDRHWIDALSQELLDRIAESIRNVPVLLLVTQRPPEPEAVEKFPIRDAVHFTEVLPAPFSGEETAGLIRLKLKQLFGFQGSTPAALTKRLAERSAGNPFYLEELLNFLKDRQVDFQQPEALEACELPASLQSLILSRIDQLTQTEQSTLKIASVVGRLFAAGIIWGLQANGGREQVLEDLGRLCQTQLISLDRPEPELVYLFKHVITQEVTYESLPHATRARLHNQIGRCLEALHAERLEQALDLLAFHFDRSENLPKKREYLERAGRAAQHVYANRAAISYYERLLPLLDERDRVATLLELGRVWELMGDWKKARSGFDRALETSRRRTDGRAEAQSHAALGDLFRRQGLCAEAGPELSTARRLFEELGDAAGLGQTLHTAGTVAAMVGDYGEARTLYEASLKIRQDLGDQAQTASLLSNLGILARYRSELEQARELMEQSLAIRRALGDQWAIANSLNNLGVVVRELDQHTRARELLQESLMLNRQVGDPWAIANTLCSIAELASDERDWKVTRECLEESLSINIDLGDRITVAYILECFARTAAGQGKAREALQLFGAATALRAALGSPLSPSETERLNNYLQPARQALSAEAQEEAVRKGGAMSFEEATGLALSGA